MQISFCRGSKLIQKTCINCKRLRNPVEAMNTSEINIWYIEVPTPDKENTCDRHIPKEPA